MSSVPGRESPEPDNGHSLEHMAAQLKASNTIEIPRWVMFVRQLAVFLLGVRLITYSVTATSKNIAYIITGLILIGVIPVETLLLAAARKLNKDKRG